MIYSANQTMQTRAAGCIIAVIDQSTSMSIEPRGGSENKSVFAARAVSNIFKELGEESVEGDQSVLRFYLGAIGYSNFVTSLWPTHSSLTLRPVTDAYTEIDESAATGKDLFKPVAEGVTRMDLAFAQINTFLDEHAKSSSAAPQPDCYPPPIIFHITDGLPTDSKGNPSITIDPDGQKHVVMPEEMKRIIARSEHEGPIMVYNIYVGDDWTLPPIILPSSITQLNDDFSRQLFAVSSPLPSLEYVDAA